MKKTVPLKKELNFKNHLAEIVSIALDHELNLENRVIKGNLIVSGSYKINDIDILTSTNDGKIQYFKLTNDIEL